MKKIFQLNFWAAAIATPTDIEIIFPTRGVSEMTPYEAWCEKKQSFHHLGVLEYIGNALLDEEEIDKLDKESN